MKIDDFLTAVETTGIDTFIGVPDSTLSQLCARLNTMDTKHHMCTVNEGAAIALAAGHYLATNKPACVYMQNSGLGNAVNPIASLTHKEVYDIPMLLIVGYRGKPGEKDEPQHVFQGKITCPMLTALDIEYRVLSKHTSAEEMKEIITECKQKLTQNHTFALVIEKDTFVKEPIEPYANNFTFVREEAIQTCIKNIHKDDVLVSTTGKISRELYEQLDALKGNHQQAFLTVGSMGHAMMIAFGIAQSLPHKQVFCIDGDGACLMHMGSLAFIAQQQPDNFVHIVLNNTAHESVGGMPTGSINASFAAIAKSCGYAYSITVDNQESFQRELQSLPQRPKPCLIEVLVKMQSRDNLGRPKESPIENKINFMKENEVIK